MSTDPKKAFQKRPSRERLNAIMETYLTGTRPPDMPGLSEAEAQAILMQIQIESSIRLEGLTRWLVGLSVALVFLTIVLAALTGVLVYDVVRRLMGN